MVLMTVETTATRCAAKVSMASSVLYCSLHKQRHKFKTLFRIHCWHDADWSCYCFFCVKNVKTRRSSVNQVSVFPNTPSTMGSGTVWEEKMNSTVSEFIWDLITAQEIHDSVYKTRNSLYFPFTEEIFRFIKGLIQTGLIFPGEENCEFNCKIQNINHICFLHPTSLKLKWKFLREIRTHPNTIICDWEIFFLTMLALTFWKSIKSFIHHAFITPMFWVKHYLVQWKKERKKERKKGKKEE